MTEISLAEAQSKLGELIASLKPGEELTITVDESTAATIGHKRRRQFGLGKDKLTIVSDDDEHLEDFQEYMP
ncbi:MAG: hypothetical protein U0996_22530 [Planctomycetaceae bacterium]